MKILEINNLSKHFDGVTAVDGVTLGFEKAAITGIIGPNGSGKTTLTNLLSGVLPFDTGAVIISGTKFSEVVSHKISAAGLTRTFQEVRLFNQMSVIDNLLVTITERSVFKAMVDMHTQIEQARAEQILKQVGLLEKMNELAANLSYGQRKLLEIARVIAMDAKIILFDEPFAGLFPEMIKIVTSIMQDLKRQGKTLILIEHNMDLIRQLSDFLYVMDSGKVLAEGKPSEVLSRREVIEAYLGE